MALIIALLFIFGLLTAVYIVNGWTLFYLWHWFMVPFGLPELSISWAIGIGIIIGFLTNRHIPKENEKIKISEAYINAFLQPLMALLVGYIVHSFMH